MDDIAERKASARRAAQAARSLAHVAGQGQASTRLTEALVPYAGAVLAGYLPMRSEIDPLPAMAAHRGRVAVPVIVGKGQPLKFREWSPDVAMQAGGFGTSVPLTGDWLVPRVLIVPLLAFDARGYRLGYGGGFYDRTLAALRAAGPVTAIGFGFAAQELPEVPTDAHDQRLDLIVSEAGVIGPF